MAEQLGIIEKPQSLAKIAYTKIRRSILEGEVKPGEIINEMSLAKILGISRTPVREALLELATQGLVTFLPRRGVQIRHFTPQDVEDVFELRKAIELASVEKISQNIEHLNLAPLEKALHSQQQALENNDRIAFLEGDRQFHSTLANLTGNRLLVSLQDNLRDMIQVMGIEALTRIGRMREVLDEHGYVYRFMSQSRTDLARKAMEDHLERSKEAVLEQHLAENCEDTNLA